MEILIVGSIIVALMVYASTKIKKQAALAYEPEVIETDDFIIEKPQGFLHPLNGEPGLAFEAYTKEFGTGEGRFLHQARAELSAAGGKKLSRAAADIREAADEIVLEAKLGGGGLRIDTIETVGEASVEAFYDLQEKGGRVYCLRIAVLSERKDEYMSRILEMRESFQLK